MTKAAVFDLDGTLVDSREDLHLAVAHALRELGLPPRTLEEVVGFVGEGAARLVARAIAPRGDLREEAMALWRAHYTEHLLDHTRLYPGMEALLARAGVPLAVHTNKPGAMARRILEGLGVLDRFETVVGGDEAPRKPDPEGTLRILEHLGARAAEAVFVGDSAVDLATARAAEVPFVAVAWGFVPLRQLEAAGAVNVAHAARDLAPWLGGTGG